MLAGVAGGVAETLDADPSLVRIVWALLVILTGGIALLVYIVMAIVVPEEPGESWPATPPVAPMDSTAPAGPTAPAGAESPAGPTAAAGPAAEAGQGAGSNRADWRAARRAERRARRQQAVDSGEAGLIFGVVLIVIGALFLIRQAIPWFDYHIWWPIGVIGLGVLLIVVAVRPRPPSG